MKLFSTLFASLAAAVVQAAAVDGTTATGNNPAGCIDPTDFDSNHDYFPDKVTPVHSLHWDIEYYNSYKVLRNLVDNETFVLYQCGTPVPTVADSSYEVLHYIPIPLQDGVALTSTTHIPHFEQLGIVSQIKGWIGDWHFVSSPCVNTMIENGEIEAIPRANRTNQTLVDSLLSANHPNMVYFHNSRDALNSSLANVTVGAYKEKENQQIYEWNKFFAVFFNLEAKSNQLVQDASNRFECYSQEAAAALQTVNSGVKPTVIWAFWNNWTGIPGWDIARCPNYYCEYADLCSTNIIHVEETDGTVPYYGRFIHTPEAFFELAKDADAFIYAGFDWDDVYTLYQDELDEFVSVQNENVFDVLGSGRNSWFEQRLAEYEIVLQDFCAVAGQANPIHIRKWFRNVFTEPPAAHEIVGTCQAGTSGYESRATPCGIVVPFEQEATTQEEESLETSPEGLEDAAESTETGGEAADMETSEAANGETMMEAGGEDAEDVPGLDQGSDQATPLAASEAKAIFTETILFGCYAVWIMVMM